MQVITLISLPLHLVYLWHHLCNTYLSEELLQYCVVCCLWDPHRMFLSTILPQQGSILHRSRICTTLAHNHTPRDCLQHRSLSFLWMDTNSVYIYMFFNTHSVCCQDIIKYCKRKFAQSYLIHIAMNLQVEN